MRNPRDIAPESIMPAYPWLLENKLDTSLTRQKMLTLQRLGVPYTAEEVESAVKTLTLQSELLNYRLKPTVPESQPDREIVALIAYLQKLGSDINWRNQP
jgi:cytochrome c oxidase cbb3-type subunit I/II